MAPETDALERLLKHVEQIEVKLAERDKQDNERREADEKVRALHHITPIRESRDLGPGKAYRQCNRPRCSSFDERTEVDVRGTSVVQFYRDPQGNVSNRVENSWTNWALVDDADGICPTCKSVVGIVDYPGSSSVMSDDPDSPTNKEAYLQRLVAKHHPADSITRVRENWKKDA